MYFVKMELFVVRIPFRFSFKHSLATRKEADSIIILLHSDDDSVGYGEVIPRHYLTGETIHSAIDYLQNVAWHSIAALNFSQDTMPLILSQLYEEAEQSSQLMAYSGLDIAIHDIVAKAANIPMWKLYGIPPKSVKLTAVIGEIGKRKAYWLSRLFYWLGFKEYKVKIRDESSFERLAAVRKAIGYSCDLRVDANTGIDPSNVCNFAERLKSFSISSIEEPTLPRNYELLAKINTIVPVMADESLCSTSDAKKLIDTNSANIFNIRLGKVGGFTGVNEILKLANQRNIACQLGVLVGETALLSQAGRHITGWHNWIHVEYGFSRFLLKKDPFSPAPWGIHGISELPKDVPGIGVNVNLSKLKRITEKYIKLTK